MRSTRLTLLLLGIYFVFIGGSAYYSLFLPVKIFHHLFVTLLFTVWLFNRTKSGQGLPATPLNKPICVMVVVWILSTLFSIDRRMALEHLWFLLIHVLMFIVLSDLIKRGRQRLLMDAQFLIATAVIFVTGLELASWYFGLGIIPGTHMGWVDVMGPGAWLPLALRRVELALNVSTLLAGFVAPLVVMAFVWSMTAASRYRKPLWTLTILLTGVLLLTLARGGLFSIAAAFAVLAVFQILRSKHLMRLTYIPVLVSGAVLVGIVLVMLVFRISTSPERAAGDEGRRDLWAGAAEIAGDYPLLGVGPGIFGRAFRSYRQAAFVQDKLASAHNLYLNTLAETGFIGLAAAGLLLIIFARETWKHWQQSDQGKRRRIEGAVAALVGIGVHSLVDTFTITPIVLLGLLLVAYCVTRPREGFEIPAFEPVYTAYIAILVLITYGVWLISIDLAQWSYQKSMQADASAFDSLEIAQGIDPSLSLYDLQRANLLGSLSPDSNETLTAYQHAIEIEPTWDTGWINLAALVLARQDYESALQYLDRARKVNSQTSASLHWARLAEEYESASPEEIIATYVTYLTYHPLTARSTFWQATTLRQQAVMQYIEPLRIDYQYRILQVQSPEQAARLVPTQPSSAAEWWVVGQAALERGDNGDALNSFNRAIELDHLTGDYYVSRAQAQLASHPQEAARDLDIATLLRPLFSSSDAVRAELAMTPDEKIQWLEAAVPSRNVPQEFAAVMYDRPSSFDVLPTMADLGPGRSVMQPWYELAEISLSEGDEAQAITIYRAILAYAPDEQDAAKALDELLQEP